jgi:hypothetical protein
VPAPIDKVEDDQGLEDGEGEDQARARRRMKQDQEEEEEGGKEEE